jgi:hypothetical protein
MGTIVQHEKVDGQFSKTAQRKANRFIRNATVQERSLNRGGQIFKRTIFKKPKNFNEIPESLLLACRFQTATQRAEFFRQVPFLKGFTESKRIGTTLKNFQIMNRIKMRFLLAPVAAMRGDKLSGDEKRDGVNTADNGEFLVRMFRRNGVIVVVESNQGKRIRMVTFHSPGLEFRHRKWAKRLFFFRERFQNRPFLT